MPVPNGEHSSTGHFMTSFSLLKRAWVRALCLLFQPSPNLSPHGDRSFEMRSNQKR
jgi:hypothetical protein